MPWIRIDDHFDEHPKLAKVGPLGWALWLAGLAYCNRNLTDGFIPWAVARSLVSWEFLRKGPEGKELIYTVDIGTGLHGESVTCPWVIEMLLDAGVWEDQDGGYLVHDYPQYQPTKAQVLAEREATRVRVEKHRRNASGNGSSTGVSTPAPVPKPVAVPDSQSRTGDREREIEATRSKQINDRMQARRLEWFREGGKWDPDWGPTPA